MAVAAVRFRLTMFAPRSAQVDPNAEVLVLTPRAGALHSDPFQVITKSGVAGWKPYLQRPNGRKGRVDFRAKKTDTGSMSITILDPRIDPTSTGNAGRWLTQFYGDEGARPAMLRCLVRIEISTDDGTSWAPWWTGRVDDVKQKEKLEFTLSLKDLNDDLTQEIFLNDPASSVFYARRAELLPYALTEDFGDIEKNRDPMLGITDTEGTGYRLGFDTDGTSAVQWRLITQELRDLATDVQRRVENFNRQHEVYLIRKGDLKCRMREFDPDTGHGALIGEFWITSIEADKFDGQWRMRWAWIERDDALGSPAFPPDNHATHVIFLRTGPASESGPILIDDIHPGTYLRDLFAGKFGILNDDGSPRYPVAMRGGTFAAIEADPTFPLIRIVQTESTTLRDHAQEICQESQIAYYVDALGRIGLVDMRRPTTVDGVTLELTDADLVSEAGSAVPTQAASEAIVHVIASLRKYQLLDPVADQIFEDGGDVYPSVPAAGLRLVDYTEEYFALGDVRTLDFNSKPTEINLKSLSAPVIQQDVVVQIGRSSFTRRRTFQEKAVDDLFAMFSHGASYFTLKCRRTATVQAVDVGTLALCSCSALANVISNLRGGTRVGICIERSEDEDVVTLAFADLGATEAADPPVLGAPTIDGGDCAHIAHLPVTLNADGDPVRVDIAIVAHGAGLPEPSSPLWEYAGTVFATTADFVITNLAPDSDVYFRARSEPRGGSSLRLPSEWVFPTPGFVVTCPLDIPDIEVGPRIAALYCLIPSAQSIGVQASDTSYNIRVQRADDADGTNTVELTGEFGVDGTTTQVDDVVDDGETKFYRAQLVNADGTPAGPWTAWISCTAEITDEPPEPVVILPIFLDDPTETTSTGLLDTTVTDPQGRLIDVSYATTDAPTFAVDASPYHAEVAKVAGSDVYITRRGRFFDGTGAVKTLDATYTYPLAVPPPEPEPTGQTKGDKRVTLIAPGDAVMFREIESGLQSLELFHHAPVNLAGSQTARISVEIDDYAPPAGTELVIYANADAAKSHDLTDAGWKPLDGANGPRVPIGDLANSAIASPTVAIAPEFQSGNVILDARVESADGIPQMTIGHLAVEPGPALPGTPPPITPPGGGPTLPFDVIAWYLGYDLGSGVLTELIDDFESYATKADAQAAGWYGYFTGGVGGPAGPADVMELELTEGEGGGHCLSTKQRGVQWAGTNHFRRDFFLPAGNVAIARGRVKIDFDPVAENAGAAFGFVSGPGTGYLSGAFTNTYGDAKQPGGADIAWGPFGTDRVVTVFCGLQYSNAGGSTFRKIFLDNFEIDGVEENAFVSWTDVTGHGHDMFGTDTPPTVGYGGDDTALDLTGGKRVVIPASLTDALAGGGEVFFVLKAPGAGPNELWKFGSSGDTSYFPDGSGHIQDDVGSSTMHDAGDPTTTLTNRVLYHAKFTATQWADRVNDEVLVSVANALGFRDGGTLGGGIVGWELVFTPPLSDVDRDRLIDRLNCRYTLGFPYMTTDPCGSAEPPPGGGDPDPQDPGGDPGDPGTPPPDTTPVPSGDRSFLIFPNGGKSFPTWAPWDAMMQGIGAWLVGACADAEAAGQKVFIGSANKLACRDSTGNFNINNFQAYLDSFDAVWAALRAGGYVASKVIGGWNIFDDFGNHGTQENSWGNNQLTGAQIDDGCRRAKLKLPGVMTMIGSLDAKKGNQKILLPTMRYLDGGYAQYSYVQGPVATWLGMNITLYKSKGWRAIFGLNIHHGGTTTPGTRGPMSPAQILAAGSVIGAHPYLDHFEEWRYDVAEYTAAQINANRQVRAIFKAAR
jgi:hypothetical protein